MPPTYKRDGRDCYLDPIRQKLIFITPEETVRQRVISYMMDTLHVPANMLRVEEHLSHYGIKSKGRADIIVEKFNEEKQETNPLVVIECKAPGIFLGESQAKQMTGYADALLSDFCMMTNGTDTFCYYYDADKIGYVEVESLPEYMSMAKGKFVEVPKPELLPRLTFDEIPGHCREYDGSDIGTDTPDSLATVCVNFWECLIYTDHKFPVKDYGIFKLIEDYGVRLLSYGNAGGGQFFGAYRSFLIEYKGSSKIDELRQFVSGEYQGIIDGKRFNLGTLINDRLWKLDDPEVMMVIENLISYALIRDEYRKYLKRK